MAGKEDMLTMFIPAPEPPTELGRYRILASRAGVRVSPLQLGAMSIGNAWEKGMGSMSKEQSFKLLDAYYEAGGNFIDTANNYQDEQSEAWIGEWMEARKNRDQIVLATKYTACYPMYRTGKGLPAVNYFGNHKRSLALSLRDSLKKLRTDWVDILYLHFWEYSTSIEEVMDALDEVVKSGKVMYLGISDTPAYIVACCNMYALAHGKTPFVIYQGRWNVMLRDMEREIIPMCRHFGMAIAPWDAIGGGRLQSKAAIEERKKNNESIRAVFAPAEQTPEEEKMSAALEEVAKEHGLTSPTAVALAYVMSKAPNVFPIVGGRKVEHLKDNINSLKIKLTDKQIEKLESVIPFNIGFPNNFIGEDPHVTGKSGALLTAVAPVAWVRSGKPIGHE